MELTRRDDKTIPVKNHKMAIERPRIVFGNLSPYLAKRVITNELRKVRKGIVPNDSEKPCMNKAFKC